ncbi:MAG: SDR family NAD(P)-dependent oxidoreductase [Hyphomicrobiaceae bacterium]|nr:SDR family NAD(P)-dependent oxidoreductase [Hyphomicrobiaceae bacterium]
MLSGTDRVAMVTGASRGIGRAVADRLVAGGFRVSAGVREPAKFTQTDRIAYFRYDAEEPKSADAWLAATIERFGTVQALANVAGIIRPYTLYTEDDANFDEMWRVNVKAPLRLIRLTLPHLKASGEGRIVNVVSVSGKMLASPVVGYAATKHAMMAVTTAVRRDAWKDGVRATAICPGFVLTDMGAGSTRVAQNDMTKAEDLAEMIHTVLLMPNTAGVPEVIVDCLDQW